MIDDTHMWPYAVTYTDFCPYMKRNTSSKKRDIGNSNEDFSHAL